MLTRPIILSFCALLLSGIVVAQEKKFAGVKARGPLSREDVAGPLSKLVSLDLSKDGRLAVSQATWDQHGMSMEDRVEQQLKKILEHMPRSMQNEAQLNAFRDQVRASNLNSLTDVFEEVCDATIGRARGGGTGLSNGISYYRSGDALELRMGSMGRVSTFELKETRRSQRNVRIVDDPGRRLFKLLIDGREFLAKIYQDEDSMSVTLFDKNNAFHETVGNWNEFVEKFPAQSVWLTESIKRAGVTLPIAETEPQTAQCVRASLQTLASDKAGELDGLLEQLRSRKKSEVDKSTERLMEIAPTLHYPLEKLWAESDDEKVREIVKPALEAARRDCEYDVRYMTLVLNRRLCDSPWYLLELASSDGFEDKELVFKRLSKLTGQDSLADVAAWKQWIEANPDAVAAMTAGPETSSGKTVFDELELEPMPEKMKEALAKVLCLQADDEGRISIERESWMRNSPTFEELLEREIKERTARGMDPDKAERFARSRLGSDRMEPGLALLQLLEEVGRSSGVGRYGRAGAGDDFVMTIGAPDSSIVVNVAGDRFELGIDGLNAPYRRVLIVDDGFDFEFTLEEGVSYLKLMQDHNSCRFVQLDKGGSEIVEHESFAEFETANPQLAAVVVECMQNAGVDPPPTRHHKYVRMIVLSEVLQSTPAVRRRFDELVKMLDSDEFEKREQAVGKLEQEYLLFVPLIDELSTDELHPETRKSLLGIQELARQRKDADQRFFRFAESRDLANSPAYLVSILKALDDAQAAAVIQHLKSMTDADPGDTVEDWQKWVQENTDQ